MPGRRGERQGEDLKYIFPVSVMILENTYKFRWRVLTEGLTVDGDSSP